MGPKKLKETGYKKNLINKSISLAADCSVGVCNIMYHVCRIVCSIQLKFSRNTKVLDQTSKYKRHLEYVLLNV